MVEHVCKSQHSEVRNMGGAGLAPAITTYCLMVPELGSNKKYLHPSQGWYY